MGSLQLYVYLQLGLQWFLTLTLLAVELYALALAFTASERAFAAADRRPKLFWVGVLGVAALFGVLSLPVRPLGLFNSMFIWFLLVLPASYFLAAIRPNLPRRR